MKKIGLNAKDLFFYGVNALTENLGPALENNPANLELDPSGDAAQKIAISEAVLQAVSVMIEKNNDALLQHLKQLGVLPKEG